MKVPDNISQQKKVSCNSNFFTKMSISDFYKFAYEIYLTYLEQYYLALLHSLHTGLISWVSEYCCMVGRRHLKLLLLRHHSTFPSLIIQGVTINMRIERRLESRLWFSITDKWHKGWTSNELSKMWSIFYVS